MVSHPLPEPFSQGDATQQSTRLGVGTSRVHGKRRRKHSGQRRDPSTREGCLVPGRGPQQGGLLEGALGRKQAFAPDPQDSSQGAEGSTETEEPPVPLKSSSKTRCLSRALVNT